MSQGPALRSAGTLPQSPLLAARACGCAEIDLPESLLEAHVSLDDGIDLPLTTLGVGFDRHEWRADALARHIVEWVPDFALRPAERANITAGRAHERLRRAYQSTFGNGGDHGVAGEVLLHAICREFYGSSTLVNKVVFKTSDNDTYKGFDGVHCVHNSDGLDLWLGEAKFYKDLKAAIRAAAKDLEDHLTADYLSREFAVVSAKIDDAHPHAEQMRFLLHPNRRLSEVFDHVIVPIFVTYESPATGTHRTVCPEYVGDLRTEAASALGDLRRHMTDWRERQSKRDDPDFNLPVHARLFLLPMAEKQRLVDEVDSRVASWLL